ncbi:hypothetical protein GCM10025857_24970 [Alicyclobacillus contaminans]|nr:hypothetical protein GCM10025857_24970 [Alicyclobacillus contaminans]
MVELSRVAAALERRREAFLERVLAPAERALCAEMGKERQVEFVAGRFAAKEAMAKAAGCGIARLGMRYVELRTGTSGLLVQFHHPRVPDVLRGRWWVSITHTAQLAFATAVRELDEGV